MGMELHWHHVGPARPQGTAVPPIPSGNYDYALVYDAKRERIVYIVTVEAWQCVQTWSWDGQRWEHDDVEPPEEGGALTENECHAYFDSRRGAVVLGSIEHDRDKDRYVPTLVVVDATGARALPIAGEPPVIEPPSEDTYFPSSQFGWVAAFDEARGVGVCFTRNGIWEIVDDTWVKRCDRPDAMPPDWHAGGGSAWDPIQKRCVMWIQERGNNYEYRFWTWDGTTCTAISNAGLPDFEREATGLFVAHPRHGIVCSAGPHGMFLLDGDAWKQLPEAANPPPLMEPRGQNGAAQMAYDPKRAAFVIGPGYHGNDPGGDAQQVFFVMRDSAWEQYGVVAKRSEIERLGDEQHAAVVGGIWYAVHKRERELWKWTSDGWQCVVDKAAGDLPRDRMGAVAAGDTLYAVTQKGAVYRLAGTGWETVAEGVSTTFKEREEFQLVHDGTRLVAWGGKVNNRKQNDTLIFDGKSWTPNKKTSPKPADFTMPKYEWVDFATIFDTTLGTLVRFGHKEVAVLQGQVWTPFTPDRYSTLCGPRSWQHLPAHDPVTGETLVVDFEAGHVVRFDLDRCKVVATLVWGELETIAKNFNTVLPRAYRHVFDPTTRTIQSQHPEDKWARYALDLGPVFDAVKAPRKKLELPVEAPKKAKKK
jgi:hypothetical protein